MLKTTTLLPLLLLATHTSAFSEVRAQAERVPGRVEAFISRRANCNHFTGEEPYDKARAAELNRVIRELRCVRVDQDEAKLRQRYRSDPCILKLLDDTANDLG